MKFHLPECETDRDAPLTAFERASAGMILLGIIAAFFAIGSFCGCIGSKASHQNGIVVYVSSSGQLGLGYGECEDLPAGCTYRREVVNISPCFWGDGTNYTHTLTVWDTRGMLATNATETAAAAPSTTNDLSAVAGTP